MIEETYSACIICQSGKRVNPFSSMPAIMRESASSDCGFGCISTMAPSFALGTMRWRIVSGDGFCQSIVSSVQRVVK